MIDTSKDLSEYRKQWYAKAEEDSTNLFEIAEDAISKDPLLNVFIEKRLPSQECGKQFATRAHLYHQASISCDRKLEL